MASVGQRIGAELGGAVGAIAQRLDPGDEALRSILGPPAQEGTSEGGAAVEAAAPCSRRDRGPIRWRGCGRWRRRAPRASPAGRRPRACRPGSGRPRAPDAGARRRAPCSPPSTCPAPRRGRRGGDRAAGDVVGEIGDRISRAAERRLAETAGVDGDHLVARGQHVAEAAPDVARERERMQQDDRRARAAHLVTDRPWSRGEHPAVKATPPGPVSPGSPAPAASGAARAARSGTPARPAARRPPRARRRRSGACRARRRAHRRSHLGREHDGGARGDAILLAHPAGAEQRGSAAERAGVGAEHHAGARAPDHPLVAGARQARRILDGAHVAPLQADAAQEPLQAGAAGDGALDAAGARRADRAPGGRGPASPRRAARSARGRRRAAAAEHVDRLAHLDGVADRRAERLVHVREHRADRQARAVRRAR